MENILNYTVSQFWLQRVRTCNNGRLANTQFDNKLSQRRKVQKTQIEIVG